MKSQKQYKLSRNSEVYFKKVSKEKDLGLIIDKKLEFDIHINERINKAHSMISILLLTLAVILI